MALKLRLPEDFQPGEITHLKESKGQTPDTQWWIATKEGTHKKYGEASPDEILWFAKEMFGELPLEDSSRLNLRVVKSTILDICLGIAIHKHRNLFGGPELWESLEDWQRADKLVEKEDKSQ